MKDIILVVGEKDTILGFKSIGLTTLFWENIPEKTAELNQYIDNGTKIIFFTENISKGIQNIMQKYQQTVYPMFVVIPSLGYENTQGKKYIQDLVVQALGSSSLENK